LKPEDEAKSVKYGNMYREATTRRCSSFSQISDRTSSP